MGSFLPELTSVTKDQHQDQNDDQDEDELAHVNSSKEDKQEQD
jgi:hypothetical protein